MDVRVRPLRSADPVRIAGAFAASEVDELADRFERYLADQERGERAVLVADFDGQVVGYVTVLWVSPSPPFRSDGLPEIKDLNVSPSQRRQGLGTALMDAAEELAAGRSDAVGIGVGMDPDYGPAQVMYVKRGYVPDGRGLTSDNRHPRWGETVRVDDDLVLYFTKRLR